MTNRELLGRIENNFINQFRLIAQANDSQFSENDSVIELVSGCSDAWMNGVLNTNIDSTRVDEIVPRTLRKYEELLCPMLWRIGPLTNFIAELENALNNSGLSFAGNETVMVLDIDQFRMSTPPPGFVVKQVLNEDDINEWMKPFGSAFAESPQTKVHIKRAVQSSLSRAETAGFFRGVLDNLPISSAHYVTSDQVTMLYGVSTLPAYQRRGYGRAVVEAAINHARSRSSFPIALCSTPAGLPMYLKMGFVELCVAKSYLFEPTKY